MPASWSAWPAGCILDLSFFDPMMIPTSGASTSISSKAASTSGIVWTPVWRCGAGSAGSILSMVPLVVGCGFGRPGGSADDALDRACRDVRPHLLAFEVDQIGGIVRPLPRLCGVGPDPGHV